MGEYEPAEFGRRQFADQPAREILVLHPRKLGPIEEVAEILAAPQDLGDADEAEAGLDPDRIERVAARHRLVPAQGVPIGEHFAKMRTRHVLGGHADAFQAGRQA